MTAPAVLPYEIDALKALIISERAAHAVERDQLAACNEKLEYIVSALRRAMSGRRSERIDQLTLALEALETEHTKTEAEAETAGPALKSERTRKRRASRNDNPDQLQNVPMLQR